MEVSSKRRLKRCNTLFCIVALQKNNFLCLLYMTYNVFTVEAFDFHNFLLQRLKAEAQQQSFLLCFA